MSRGYFGIGIENGKTPANLGTLWRSAHMLGADFVFTIGRRYDGDPTDTLKSTRHVPLLHFPSTAVLSGALDRDCRLVGVEMDGDPLPTYRHPERAVYLLGAEDAGLTTDAHGAATEVIGIPTVRSLNVAVAGSIVLYDRMAKA